MKILHITRFRKFVDDSFRTLSEKQIDRIIIDVRNNVGGNSTAALYLANNLTKQPVYSFDRILWKSSQQVRDFVLDDIQNHTHEWYEQEAYDNLISVNLGECYEWDCKNTTEVLDKKNIFNGRVFVLSNEMCFSTTTDFLAMVRDFHLGSIVGTQSGGLPNSFGDCYYFDLPHTKLNLSVSQKYFVRPSGNEKDNDLSPDFIVKQTEEDRKSGIDTVMEFAKRLCKK